MHWKGMTAAVLAISVSVAACFSEKSDDLTGPAPEYVSCSSSAPAPPANARVVRIRNFAFEPAQLTVAAGTTVWWINCETPAVGHTSTSDTGIWSSPLLAGNGGGRFSRAFSATGTFPYHCVPHPEMVATITVQ
jgi:plastocyanin